MFAFFWLIVIVFFVAARKIIKESGGVFKNLILSEPQIKYEFLFLVGKDGFNKICAQMSPSWFNNDFRKLLPIEQANIIKTLVEREGGTYGYHKKIGNPDDYLFSDFRVIGLKKDIEECGNNPDDTSNKYYEIVRDFALTAKYGTLLETEKLEDVKDPPEWFRHWMLQLNSYQKSYIVKTEVEKAGRKFLNIFNFDVDRGKIEYERFLAAKEERETSLDYFANLGDSKKVEKGYLSQLAYENMVCCGSDYDCASVVVYPKCDKSRYITDREYTRQYERCKEQIINLFKPPSWYYADIKKCLPIEIIEILIRETVLSEGQKYIEHNEFGDREDMFDAINKYGDYYIPKKPSEINYGIK